MNSDFYLPDAVSLADAPVVSHTINGMTGAANAKKPRQAEDFYRSPPSVTEALLRAERFRGTIHEPACGDGAISEVLRAAGHEVVSQDLVDRGYGEAGVDFMQQRKRPDGCDTLITNPPFAYADEFALHALHLGYSHICLFARLAWLEGDRRHKQLWSKHPPSRIWIFRKRQTLWRGDEASPGKGGTLAFQWCVWQAGHTGPTVGWI